MTTSLRRRLRFARRGAWYLVAAVLVAMALGAVAMTQLLAMAERHPERIAEWLSARAGRPVAFDAVETEWTRRGPLLRLDGLRVGEGDAGIAIGEAEILVSQYAGLLPGRSFTELRLRGLQLALERSDDGRWQVRGLPGEGQAGGDPLETLESLGELQVVGSRLAIHAPSLGVDVALPRIDLRLRVDGDRVRAAARAWMHEGVSPVDAVVDIDRRRGDGHAHAAAMQADLAAWSALLRHAGIVVEAGSGRAQAWAGLRGMRIESVTMDATLRGVVLRGAPVAAGRDAPVLRVGQLSALARLRMEGGDWRIAAPRLRIGEGAGAQVLDGLMLAGGQRFALRAGRIDAGPLVAVAALSDRLDAGLRNWLLASSPDAVLHDIDVAGVRGGRMRASARVEELRFGTVGDAPGLSGLAGEFSGDGDGFAFAFDPSRTLRFDWPSGFGPPHDLHLRGTFAGWREGDGLRVESPALRIDGDGYAADVRGGLWFQNDGTHPVIDLAATLDEAAIPVAKRFWVRHKMPDAAERWLDAALVGGKVRNGRAVVSGDLDDWPFSAREQAQSKGLFHAEGDLVGAVVKFQPDWPAAERIDAVASFVNDGFTVKGKGEIAGVSIPSLDAALPHYGEARLAVRATTGGDAGKLLALLRQSPLHGDHAETFDNLSASGPVAATFALDLPMHGADTAPRIDGSVELRGATLAEERWKLAFEGVRGRARYDHHGFHADGLAAVRDGQPGTLSLRAGEGHVEEGGNAFEAELDASLSADDLLAQAPELGWLSPHVDGRSRWNIAVSIPKAASPQQSPRTRLRLRSDLAGIALTLPQPLRKDADATLPTTISTTLPMDGGDVAIAFGQRLALRARSAQGRTGVRVLLGTGETPEAPPASGLVVSGRTATLDAIDWATLATGDGDGEGLSLRSVDVTAAQLQLLGSSFPETRITAAPDGDATQVLFDGVALAGALRLPRERSAPVSGRFQRLHWTAANPLAQPAGAPRPPPPAEDGVDPARVPPLQLDIDDLRFGKLAMGKASLRTRPLANGLRVERLQTRSDAQRIDATGEWTGRGAAARTRLVVDVGSGDFGTLLDGLGFGKRIDGGEGTLHFDAAWPRSPADFEVGALEGTLAATIKDGRLAEVEPGAGRVLGLLSVAELPRRLMLDFRDFFSKGFAFNRIGGSVRFANGQASSDDIVIDGPAAELRIQGRSDLRAQTHDQRIDVLPKTGNLLTAVGAIAGGPVGAAVGAVANAVLRGPLGEINARTYRVTGPWADPKVEVSEHAPARQAATPAPPDDAPPQ